MATISLPSEAIYEASLRQAEVKHALKTALACLLVTVLVYAFRLRSGQLVPVFAYLLFSLGMPSPRLTWLLAQLGIVISALVSAAIVLVCRDLLLLYLAVTLAWIFLCMQFSSGFPLPAALSAMVSALGVFTFFHGTVGDTLNFFVDYPSNFLIGGLVVVAVYTLLWPFTAQKVFMRRLAEVYVHLERECRQAARQVAAGEPSVAPIPSEEWAPFRSLRQTVAPELRRGRDTSNPFARMILACRSLNLRLWFFNRVIAPMASATLPATTRQQLANLLDRCAAHLQTLVDSLLTSKRVASDTANLQRVLGSDPRDVPPAVPIANPSSTDILVAHDIPRILSRRLTDDLKTMTTAHNALLARLRGQLGGELVAFRPFTSNARLFDANSLRSGAKLVVILLFLLVEEAWLGLPGGTQVAFFATFFASTGNLGRQNKTDLVGLLGLLSGFIYGVLAAFLTSRLPHFALLLSLVFLGQFLSNLAYLKLPRFSAAGVQAGLAIPFAFLATTGPEWGSFTTVRTRFAGLVVAGCTAVVVHAYLWPVLPMRQLRASIAAALRATATSLVQLFRSREAWSGAPPSLTETVTRARDLLDDARYLPGAEHADPAYDGVLAGLQEMDANLEYIHFLVGLEEEHPLRQRFFQVIGDYAEQARGNLEHVARQFQPSPRRAARVQAIRWGPDASGRWESASRAFGPVPVGEIDPSRPAVIARCLDQVAQAALRISEIVREINLRSYRR
jgi:hypothetical protein